MNTRLFTVCTALTALLLVCSTTRAEPIDITSVEIDTTTQSMSIHGKGFGQPYLKLFVLLDESPLEAAVMDDSLIQAALGGNYLVILQRLLAEGGAIHSNLQVIMEIEEVIQDENGDDVTVEAFETADYCMLISAGDLQVADCGADNLLIRAGRREVRWQTPVKPNPGEDDYAEFAYKFGPATINDGSSRWGDPVYYQLLEDYEISLEAYLDNYHLNDFGDTLLDRCQSALNNNALTGRLDAISGSGWPINAAPEDQVIRIENGVMKLKRGWRWDGPTLNAPDFVGGFRVFTKPPTVMRGSGIHDAIYDLMRAEAIKQQWVRVAYSKAWYNRKLGDCLLYMFSRQDGYFRDKARANYDVIRTFGAGKTKDDLPGWKFHATADAGEYEPTECAADSFAPYTLDGRESLDAVSYAWSVENVLGGPPQEASGVMPDVLLAPGEYLATVSVNDGDDHTVYPYFEDTDTAAISIVADTVAPEFLLAEDIDVPNDPGLCGADVRFRAIATDDCGPPTVYCSTVPDAAPVPTSGVTWFEVGTTQVECTAEDINQAVATDVWVTVNDIEPPVLDGITAPLCMWPPNRRYDTFTIEDFVHSVTDNCADADVRMTITSVRSDEVGANSRDIRLAADGQSVQLLRQRFGKRNGRVYMIDIEARDAADNVTRETYYVHVPIDQQCKAINDGAR